MEKLNLDEMIFSQISGYNYYAPSEEHGGGMIHVPCDADVYFEKCPQLDAISVQNKWRNFILWPPNTEFFIWPVDIVTDRDGDSAFVFQKKAYPNLRPLKQLLYDDRLLDWHEDGIKLLADSLLTALMELHDAGYAYHAFDINRMYYNTKTMKVKIRFSTSMARFFGHPDSGPLFFLKQDDPLKVLLKKYERLRDLGISFTEISSSEKVINEFVPPWVQANGQDTGTLQDDYYSIAALLFRLFTGRMPYQGNLMTRNEMADFMNEERDNEDREHQRMVAFYHEHPVFIFDPQNQSNHIGTFSHEQVYIDRWTSLPESIQKMFSATFIPPADNWEKWTMVRKDELFLTPKYWLMRSLVSPVTWKHMLKKERVI